MNEADDLHLKLVSHFDDYVDTMRDADDNAIEAREYRDHRQWTAKEEAELRRRGQPVVVDNIIADKVDLFVGLHTSTNVKPSAFPRTPQDEAGADSMAKALDFVSDSSGYTDEDEYAVENMTVEGTGILEILGDEKKIECNHVPWDRFFYDPFSRRLDFTDANYLGTVVWMDLSAARRIWPDTDALSIDERDSETEKFDDQPDRWISHTGRRTRIRVVQCYWRDGNQTMRATYTKHGYLSAPEKSPYLDDESQTIWPYVAESAYITRDGVRYGMVERFKHLQREHNKRRSKLLHLLSTNRVKVMEGSRYTEMSTEQIRREAARPDSVFRFDESPDEIVVEQNSADAQGQAALMQDTLNRLENIGPNEALQGTQNASGRSLQIQQRAGTMQLGPLLNRARSMRRRTFEQFYFRIKQFWREPKWIRVTDSEEGVKEWVGLNQPQIMNGQLVGVENNVAMLNYDVVIEDTPDYVSMMAEQFDNLVTLATAGVTFPPEVYIEASSLRNKQELLDKLKGVTDDPQAQAEAQRAQQLQQRAALAEITKAEGEARNELATAEWTHQRAEGQELENLRNLLT